MNKWDNKKTIPSPSYVGNNDIYTPPKEITSDERTAEWTFQMAKAMITTGKWTISVVPSTALNLVKEIEAHLQSAGYLPKSSSEEKSS